MAVAKVLTGGDEKLVRSVDHMKGVLIHDVVDVLQCVINKQIKSRSARNNLTCRLTIVSNFLKNQFKDHVNKEDGWDMHGVQHGLAVSPLEFNKPQHYSEMDNVEVNKLCRDRVMDYRKKSSKKARIVALEEHDQKLEDNKTSDSKLSDAKTLAQEDDVSGEANYIELCVHLDKMSLKEL